MSAEFCCGGVAVRALCPYHGPAAAPAPVPTDDGVEWDLSPNAPVVRVDVVGPTVLRGGVTLPAGARLLGPDDPEVLGPDTPPDMIYAVPGGGVVGVPQGASAASVTPHRPVIGQCACDSCYRMMWTDGVVARCFDCSGVL